MPTMLACSPWEKSWYQIELTLSTLAKLPIALPPPAVQKRIVDEIQAEQALVSANCDLIRLMVRRIQNVIARVWEN